MASDFGFMDVDGDSLAEVRILGFEGNGTLRFGGDEFQESDLVSTISIPVSQIDQLSYQPDLNDNGDGVATIRFEVVDDGDEQLASQESTLSVNIAPLNDAPTGTSNTETINEDEVFSFTRETFGFMDVDGNEFESIRIQSVTGGTLATNTGEVLNGETILVEDLSELRFTPTANLFNFPASIEFTVIDDGLTGAGNQNEDTLVREITFDVNAVSDQPVGKSFTVPINEETSYQFSVSDFAFDDSDDSPTPNTLAEIRVIDWIGPGQITFDGIPIEMGSTFNVADISRLAYEAFDVAENTIGTVSFALIDDGSTANSGLIESDPLEITFEINQVNQAPEILTETLSTNENSTESLSITVTDGDLDPTIVSFTGTENDNSFFVIEITPDGPSIRFNSAPDFEAQASLSGDNNFEIELIANDGNGGFSAVQQITVTVEDVLEPVEPGEPIVSDNNRPTPETTPSTDDSEDDENQLTETGPPNIPQEDPEITIPESPISTTSFVVNDFGANTFSNDSSFADIDGQRRILTTPSEYSTYTYSSFVDTGLLTGEFVSRISTAGRQGLQEFAGNTLLTALFWQELDTANHDFIHTEFGEFESAITVGALSLSGVAVTVLARAALLGLSFGATYSQTWWMNSFDFLPIIESEDDESIEQIVEREG